MSHELEESEIIRIEELSLNAWPAIITVQNNGCLLRFSNGYTKRSNSVNALYHNGNLDEIINFAERLYSKNKLPTIFKILDHSKYNELDDLLEHKRYDKLDATTVKTLLLADHDFLDDKAVHVEEGFSPAWMDGFIACNRLESKSETVKAVLGNIMVETLVASVSLENEMIGFGFGAVEGDYVGFFDIFIKQDHRGVGYGRKIMESMLNRAKKKGVPYGYLQVMDNNYPANMLYDKLGFKPAYRYWYRKRRSLI